MRDMLFSRWLRERERGKTPAYWIAVAALVRWDEDHPEEVRGA